MGKDPSAAAENQWSSLTVLILSLNIVVFVILCALVAGCANPSVVQMSPGVYELARADHGGIFGNEEALKAGVIRDANAFAESQGKVAIPVAARQHPVGIMGDWASYEYDFRVVDKDSPEAKIPRILVRSDAVRTPEFRSVGNQDVLYKAEVVQ